MSPNALYAVGDYSITSPFEFPEALAFVQRGIGLEPRMFTVSNKTKVVGPWTSGGKQDIEFVEGLLQDNRTNLEGLLDALVDGEALAPCCLEVLALRKREL